MNFRHLFLLLVIACSQSAFSQIPKAYLVGSGNQADDLSRPRIYVVQQSPTKAKSAPSLERETFEMINEQRALIGLKPLEWSDEAAKIARLHSENMANYNFFSHTGIDGLLVNDRADLLGIKKWQAIGENIAYNRGYEKPIEFAVERWMQSPKHRDNLLNSRWKESGVGIAITDDNTYYFTEVFLVRR